MKSDARKGGGFCNAAPSLEAGEREKAAVDFCSLRPSVAMLLLVLKAC